MGRRVGGGTMPDNIDGVLPFSTKNTMNNSVGELVQENNEARLTQVAKSEERAIGV